MHRLTQLVRSPTGLAMLGLAVSPVGWAQQSGRPDPFAKPVTVHLKMVTVRSALKELGKAGGMELGARDALGDLKVTLLVKDEPLGSVMARIGDLFHAAWSANGTGRYELAVPAAWTNHLDAYMARENEERRKNAESQIKKLVSGASMPYDQVLATLHSDQSNLTPQQLEELASVASPEDYLLGAMFARMTPSEMADFWNGRVERSSDTLPATAGAPFGPTAGPPGPPIRRRGQPTMGRVVRVMAFYDSLSGQLSMGNAGRGQLGRTPLDKVIDHPYPTGPLAETPFGKEVLAWNGIENDAPRLQPQVQAVMLRGSYSGGLLSAADAMEWLHDQTGVPIVADAFRTPVKMPRRGGSIANWLTGFKEENSAFIRTDGGFVMMRHGGFWRLRGIEAPEEVYASLESTPNPSLDQYAAFAAALTPAQTLPFRVKGAVLLKVDPAPLSDGMAALRFYASLGGDARRVALAGTPIPFSQLGPASQGLFVDAMDNPLGGQPVGTGVPDVDSPAAVRRLGFLVTTAVVLRPGPPIPGLTTGPSTGFQMLFGASPTAGVQYLIPLDH